MCKFLPYKKRQSLTPYKNATIVANYITGYCTCKNTDFNSDGNNTENSTKKLCIEFFQKKNNKSNKEDYTIHHFKQYSLNLVSIFKPSHHMVFLNIIFTEKIFLGGCGRNIKLNKYFALDITLLKTFLNLQALMILSVLCKIYTNQMRLTVSVAR